MIDSDKNTDQKTHDFQAIPKSGAWSRMAIVAGAFALVQILLAIGLLGELTGRGVGYIMGSLVVPYVISSLIARSPTLRRWHWAALLYIGVYFVVGVLAVVGRLGSSM